LFACIVPTLCGDCTMPWHSSVMLREQLDCCVRMEVCLCCGLMSRFAGSCSAID
jgi:hypothetical protein